MPKLSRKKLRNALIQKLVSDSDLPSDMNVAVPENPKNIFISFDIATKSLAFCIVKVPENITKSYSELKSEYVYCEQQIADLLKLSGENTCTEQEVLVLKQRTDSLSNALREFVVIYDADVVNLIPDKKDKDISEVERIKALVNYFNTKLVTVINKLGLTSETLTVLIEHQMAPNTKARAIASALIAMFADYEVYIVKPVLKNRINLSNDDHWINFVKKYKTLYTANKKHAIHNFEILSKDFTFLREEPFKKTEISHVSDAFMQVLGYLKHKKN